MSAVSVLPARRWTFGWTRTRVAAPLWSRIASGFWNAPGRSRFLRTGGSRRPVRLAAATNTLTVSLFYLLAQMAGAGGLVALLLNVNSSGGQAIVIAVVGVLMILYVLVGGMKGTTWVQIIKAVLLIAGAGAMTLMVLGKFGLNFSEILGAAQSAISGSTTEAVANRCRRPNQGLDLLTIAPAENRRCWRCPPLQSASTHAGNAVTLALERWRND